jgi:hypothetical protein
MLLLIVDAERLGEEAETGGDIVGGRPEDLYLPRYWLKTGRTVAFCESLVRKKVFTRQRGKNFERGGYKGRRRDDLWYAPHPRLTEDVDAFPIIRACLKYFSAELRVYCAASYLQMRVDSFVN